MAWRLHLSDSSIRRLDILSGKPALLAAWTQANRVSYLDLQNGTQQGDCVIPEAKPETRFQPAWADFIKTLCAPNGVYLPSVRSAKMSVYMTADGATRLYQTSPSELFLEIDGKEARLEVDGAFATVVLDRAMGMLAALDTTAKLHLYQHHVRLGVFETGLKVDEEFSPTLVIAQAGTGLFLSDGQVVLAMDTSGRVRKRLSLHYRLGAINCSPDGKRFVASDLDSNVVRVYDGDLTPTHQRYAVDLLAEAKKAQLMASASMASAALGPLAINNKGVLAFALSGTVCVTSLTRMKAHPKG